MIPEKYHAKNLKVIVSSIGHLIQNLMSKEDEESMEEAFKKIFLASE